jgi:hypothetical protein
MVVKAVVVALVVARFGLDTVVLHVLVAIYVDMIFMAATRMLKEANMMVLSFKDVLGEGVLLWRGRRYPNHVTCDASVPLRRIMRDLGVRPHPSTNFRKTAFWTVFFNLAAASKTPL